MALGSPNVGKKKQMTVAISGMILLRRLNVLGQVTQRGWEGVAAAAVVPC